MRRVACALGLGLALGLVECDRKDREWSCTENESLDLFDDRIAPLLSGERQSTCNECHLEGVDLGMYARADPCATMACMVESGIVDPKEPSSSVVLDWILRSEPASELITDDVIRAEHDAVLEWIEYNATCGSKVCAPIENPCGPSTAGTCEIPSSAPKTGRREFEDPGDCREETLEAGFAALVYSWRGRCYPCHFDSRDGEPVEAPRWIHDAECNLGALETMHNVFDLPGVVDLDAPEQSLLLLKPLAEDAGGVVHGGGDKFASKDDPAYQDFLAWIARESSCRP